MPLLLQCLHKCRLLLRKRVGNITGDPQFFRHLFRDSWVVASQHDDLFHPSLAQGLDGTRRLRAERVSIDYEADQPPVYGDEQGRGRSPAGRQHIFSRPTQRHAFLGHKAVAPHEDASIPDHSFDP